MKGKGEEEEDAKGGRFLINHRAVTLRKAAGVVIINLNSTSQTGPEHNTMDQNEETHTAVQSLD